MLCFKPNDGCILYLLATAPRGIGRVAMVNRHLQFLFELVDRLRRRAVIQYSACQ
jgi:hypothetical protein